METKRFAIIVTILMYSVYLNAQVFTNYTDSTSGLPDNFINGGVAIDQNNNKWFGTGSGVAKFDDVTWTVYTTSDGLIDNFTTCIAIDIYNNVWVGTDVGASKFDGNNWTNYTSSDGLPTDGINDIRCDANGNIWFATYAGLSKFNGTSFTNYSVADGLSMDLITNVTTDDQNNVWLGTLGAGISKFDGSVFTNFGASSNIIDTNIISIMVDHNGNKWAGTFYGVSVFNNTDVWSADYTFLDGLYGDYIRDIEEDSQGNIWFGIFVDYLFDGAITKFDGTNWVSYSVPQGLVDVQVKRLAIDQQDNIWIATGSGVSKFEDITTIDENLESFSFNVYPNPASEKITICSKKASQNRKINIVNTLGQIMDEYYFGSDERIEISLENYSEGMYLIKSANETQKFFVNK